MHRRKWKTAWDGKLNKVWEYGTESVSEGTE